MKIASKRQVTLPGRLLQLLDLNQGDMIEIIVRGKTMTGHGLKLVPTSLFTEKLLQDLQRQDEEMDNGDVIEVEDMNELERWLKKK